MSEPIFTVECQEPNGPVNHSVYFMPLSVENMRTMWEKSRKFNTLFNYEVKADFSKFVEVLLQSVGGSVAPTGLFWVVDNFIGVFYMTRIIPGVDALVHYSFFDGKHRGRETLVRKMIQWGFERYDFKRITVEVPLYVTLGTFFFVEKALGFKKEGRKRHSTFYKGQWYDVNLYGMLRDEAFAEMEPVDWKEYKEAKLNRHSSGESINGTVGHEEVSQPTTVEADKNGTEV